MRYRFEVVLLLFLVLFSAFSFTTYENLIFENLNSTNGLSQHDINCILQDNDGYMWFGTNDGLNKYDGYNFEVFKPLNNKKSSISGRIIQQIVSDFNGNL